MSGGGGGKERNGKRGGGGGGKEELGFMFRFSGSGRKGPEPEQSIPFRRFIPEFRPWLRDLM